MNELHKRLADKIGVCCHEDAKGNRNGFWRCIHCSTTFMDGVVKNFSPTTDANDFKMLTDHLGVDGLIKFFDWLGMRTIPKKAFPLSVHSVSKIMAKWESSSLLEKTKLLDEYLTETKP